MHTDVTVIVSRCEGNPVDGYRIFGVRLFEQTFSELPAAFLAGMEKVKEGRSVLIRPTYNERGRRAPSSGSGDPSMGSPSKR